MSQKPTVGGVVLVVVPRSTNGGQDHAPAIITHVNDDGTVDLHAFLRVGFSADVYAVQLLEDRAAVQKEMAKHFELLPGASEREEPDGTRTPVPGVNSTNGQPWNHSDVAHWVKLAYWPPAPAAPETPEQTAVRVAREQAAAAEAKAARRAELAAELAAFDAAGE